MGGREREGRKERERVGGRGEERGGISRTRMRVWGWGVLWRGAESFHFYHITHM